MPVKHVKKPKDHHHKNLENLKTVFRKKHTLMPYKTPELKRLPLDKIKDETRVEFDPTRLPEE